MNTYKHPRAAVEPQKAAPAGLILHVGLDVHNDSIAPSLAPSDSTEVRRWGIIGGTHEHVQKFLKQLQAAHPGATLRCCYEAGPRGYPLGRFIRSHGAACIIVAPSRVPRQPGKGMGFSLRRAGCGVDSSGRGFLQAKDGAAAGGLGIAR